MQIAKAGDVVNADIIRRDRNLRLGSSAKGVGIISVMKLMT
jgi:hypothetical protein